MKCKNCKEDTGKRKILCGKCYAKNYRKEHPEVAIAYRERNKDRINEYNKKNKKHRMEWWDKYYTENRKEIQQRKKKQRQANNYKEDRTENRKLMAAIRFKTRKKYPLDGRECSKCENIAEHRHHTTNPPEVDKFIFVCKDCHDKIHGRKNYQKEDVKE